MQNEFDILKQALIAECSNGPVYYYANPGNWGDGLIRYGALKLFNDINLNFIELEDDRSDNPFSSLSEGTLIYGGSGNWCALWNKAIIRLSNLNHNLNIFVLPSTFEHSYSVPNATFFCRDMFESKENMPNSTFCHDMAFYIGQELSKESKGSGTGYFLREDAESTNRFSIPPSNNDISLKNRNRSDITPFFDEINSFDVICTDRLHVSIAGCLLNKEVHLYPSSYFKNQAIYKSSLENYFENIYFHEDFELQ